MNYRQPRYTYLIVFRGTDDSIIGWKEDFHDLYMKKIPAKARPSHYLELFCPSHPKQGIILWAFQEGKSRYLYAATN